MTALNLLSPEEKAMIDYHGFGPEHIISNNEGLFAVENVRNPLDGVPIIGNDINPVRRPLGFIELCLFGTAPINDYHADENVIYYYNYKDGFPGTQHTFDTYYSSYLSPGRLKHR